MKASFVPILFLLATETGAQNTEKEYLQNVLANLEKIESATYYLTGEAWQQGDTTAFSTNNAFIKEYHNPMDSTIGASYVCLDANDTTKLEFCYDGNARVMTNHDKKELAIDDFTFRPLPFRPLKPPFFNYTRNIIHYALTTNDSITIELLERTDDYYFKLVIEEDKQVEFFGKAFYMPNDPNTMNYTTSIYEIWIDKTSNLPYKTRREMSHDISVNICSDVKFNQISIKDFKAADYFPKGYAVLKYSDIQTKKKNLSTASKLVGQQAPDWTLENIHAQKISLSDYKSKVLLINFTGIGCGACQAAIPFLQTLKEQFSDTDFELIAIESWSRKIPAIQNYSNKKKLNYTLLNANDEVIRNYATAGAAPYFFIINKERVISKVIRGYAGERTNQEIINAIKEQL